MKTFEINNDPLEISCILRAGSSGRIAQVVALRGDDVLLVLAGRINKGEHVPSLRPMAVSGMAIQGRNMVLVEGKNMTEVYTKVTVNIELHNLPW